MGRYSENKSYGHDITIDPMGGYYIEWCYDTYSATSRLRNIVTRRQWTDEAGAKRFAKKHGLDLPVRPEPTKAELDHATEELQAGVERDVDAAYAKEAARVEAIETPSVETTVEGLAPRTTGAACVHCGGTGDAPGEHEMDCGFCKGTGKDPKMETDTIERLTCGEAATFGVVDHRYLGDKRLSWYLYCHTCSHIWHEVDGRKACPKCSATGMVETLAVRPGKCERHLGDGRWDWMGGGTFYAMPNGEAWCVECATKLREQYEAEVASGRIRTLKSVCPQCGKAIEDGGKMVHGAGPYCVPCADGFLAYERTEPKGVTEANRLAAMLPKDLVVNERGNIILEDPNVVGPLPKGFDRERAPEDLDKTGRMALRAARRDGYLSSVAEETEVFEIYEAILNSDVSIPSGEAMVQALQYKTWERIEAIADSPDRYPAIIERAERTLRHRAEGTRMAKYGPYVTPDGEPAPAVDRVELLSAVTSGSLKLSTHARTLWNVANGPGGWPTYDGDMTLPALLKLTGEIAGINAKLMETLETLLK